MKSQQIILSKAKAIKAVLGVTATTMFIVFTNPNSLPAVFLLVLPALIFATTYWISEFMVDLFVEQPSKNSRLLSGVIAVAPMLVVVLGSVGQLGLQDITLALLLAGGLSWYLKRLQTA